MGDLWSMGLQDQEVLEGAVGRPFVTEFLGFIELIESLGDLPSRICNGESPVLEDDSPSICFALATSLASLASDSGALPNIEEWMKNNMTEEFQMVWFKDASRRHGEQHLIDHGNFTKWARRLEKWIQSS